MYRLVMETKRSSAQDQLHAWIRMEGRKIGWLADQVGVNRSTLSLWLNGHQTPHPAFRKRVEEITGVDADAWSRSA